MQGPAGPGRMITECGGKEALGKRLPVSSQTERGVKGIPGRRHCVSKGLEARNTSGQRWRGWRPSQQQAQSLPTYGCCLQTLAQRNSFPLHPRVASEALDFLWVGGR